LAEIKRGLIYLGVAEEVVENIHYVMVENAKPSAEMVTEFWARHQEIMNATKGKRLKPGQHYRHSGCCSLM